MRRRGFNRLYQNNRIFEFSTPESLLDLDFTLPVFILVDRIVVSQESRARIVDAAEIGYRESGEILYETIPVDDSAADRERLRFSMAFECKTCHRTYREPELRLFSLIPGWRMRSLPGLWQHHRFRPEPDHSRQRNYTRRLPPPTRYWPVGQKGHTRSSGSRARRWAGPLKLLRRRLLYA